MLSVNGDTEMQDASGSRAASPSKVSNKPVPEIDMEKFEGFCQEFRIFAALDLIQVHACNMDAKTTATVMQKLARMVLWNDVSVSRQSLVEHPSYTLLQRRVLLHHQRLSAFQCANVIWALSVFCDLAPGSDGELTFYHVLNRLDQVIEDLELACIQVLVVSFARHRIERQETLEEISRLGLELLKKKKDDVVAENVSEILWGLSQRP
jgi:hypothetical protein